MRPEFKHLFLLIVFYVIVLFLILFNENLRKVKQKDHRRDIFSAGHSDRKLVLGQNGTTVVFLASNSSNSTKLDRLSMLRKEKYTSYRHSASNAVQRDIKLVYGQNGTIIAYLNSAIAGNSSHTSKWDRLSIIGWFLQSHEQSFNKCCVLFSSGLLQAFPVVPEIARSTNICPLLMRQFTCAVEEFEKHESGTDKPISMSVSPKSDACHQTTPSFVDIVYPDRQADKIALFGRIVYGNISALNLLAWFELHRMYGLHKVFMYTHDLSKEATKVFDYYRTKELLETVPFITPGPDVGVTKVGDKDSQGFSYDVAAHADALERLRGYKYLVSIDIDEYLIPVRHTTWTELFNDMWKKNQSAASFKFKTYFYRKMPDLSMTDSPFDVCRYLKRSRLIHRQHKQVLMPDRVMYGGLSSHGVMPANGYLTATANETDVVLRHYRFCKPNDRSWKFYCFSNRTLDDTVCSVFKDIQEIVNDIASDLGLFW